MVSSFLTRTSTAISNNWLSGYSQRLKRRSRLRLKVKKAAKKKRSRTTDPLLLEPENRPKTHLVSATSWPPSTTLSST